MKTTDGHSLSRLLWTVTDEYMNQSTISRRDFAELLVPDDWNLSINGISLYALSEEFLHLSSHNRSHLLEMSLKLYLNICELSILVMKPLREVTKNKGF